MDLVEANFSNADFSFAQLDEVVLAKADLTNTTFYGAALSGACFYRARLTGANFYRANLSGADFCEADLTRVNLGYADLTSASLWEANLTDANLARANLTGANFTGTNFNETNIGETLLVDVDLGPLARALNVHHDAPSQFDWRTLARSIGEPFLKDFLRRSGMPDVFVEYMVDCARCLDRGMVFSLLQSTFISYGGPDEAFARKLNEALERRGVTTFFFRDDAPPGERLHRVMRKGVNEHDRTILICSEASLQRPGLLNELEETVAREGRDGGATYLLPVRLDDYVLSQWAPRQADLAQAVRDRVIADFRRHHVAGDFDAEVAKLIAVLKKPVVPT